MLNHSSGIKVVEASTKEFCIARYLHKTSDVAAAFNIGRVIALRCKEVGLNRVMWEHKTDRKQKGLQNFGIDVCNDSAFVISGDGIHEGSETWWTYSQ